jgi:hypothetical protein
VQALSLVVLIGSVLGIAAGSLYVALKLLAERR